MATANFTNAQLATLKAAILADPNLTTFVTNGQDNQITAYYNGASSPVVSAWAQASQSSIYEATDIAKFDNVTAGKREAWRMLLDFSPTDFRRAKYRKAVTDIWGATEAANVLAACATRTATKGEALFGGTDRTESTVTAKVLNWEGTVRDDDISTALRG